MTHLRDRRRCSRSPITKLLTPAGEVRAGVVVRATEGFTPELPGRAPRHRAHLLADARHRAAAGELLGRRRLGRPRGRSPTAATCTSTRCAPKTTASRSGAAARPTTSSSRMSEDYEHVPRVHAVLERTLKELFPAARDARITHAWGGAWAIPRDWFPSVGWTRRAGTAWAGGYVGDGVAATNLAGRTLADLITGTETPLVRTAVGRPRFAASGSPSRCAGLAFAPRWPSSPAPTARSRRPASRPSAPRS